MKPGFPNLAWRRKRRAGQPYCAILSRRTARLCVSPAPNGPRHWGGEGGNDPARLTRLMAAAQTPARWCHRLRQGVMTVDGIRSVAGTRRPDLQLTSPPVPRLPVRFPSPHATDHAEPLATVLPGRASRMLPQIFRAANQFSLALPAGKSPLLPVEAARCANRIYEASAALSSGTRARSRLPQSPDRLCKEVCAPLSPLRSRRVSWARRRPLSGSEATSCSSQTPGLAASSSSGGMAHEKRLDGQRSRRQEAGGCGGHRAGLTGQGRGAAMPVRQELCHADLGWVKTGGSPALANAGRFPKRTALPVSKEVTGIALKAVAAMHLEGTRCRWVGEAGWRKFWGTRLEVN